MKQPARERVNLDNSPVVAVDGACASTPNHIAIIMDGNGRWATTRGRSRLEGHRAGTENIRRVIESCANANVNYLTLFAFSTENWDRPDDEVHGLMEILGKVIRDEVRRLHEQSVKIRHLGRLDRLPRGLQRAICDSTALTRNNTGLNLSVAFDYGGRDEILQAVRRIVADGLSPDRLTEGAFRSYLYSPELPDPDLIIRTAGEMRLSNFLLWQSAYAEYYATSVLWPDFDDRDIAKALEAYSQRQRRYGRVPLAAAR